MPRDYTKEEEATEIQSLRRIISAYLNYSDAALEDVKRHNRYYERLSPEHKALLPHIPAKFVKLTRRIGINMFFITNMIHAFQPPFDLSQDIDAPEQKNQENRTDKNFQLDASSPVLSEDGKCSEQIVELCGANGEFEKPRIYVQKSSKNELINGNDTKELPKSNNESGLEHWVEIRTDQVRNKSRSNREKSSMTDFMNGIDTKEEMPEESTVGVSLISEQQEECSGCSPGADGCHHIANGNAYLPSHSWLNPSVQSRVQLADVDKVRCIIRNIVRDWAAEGQVEREQCYKPILQELDRLFPCRSQERPPCCLVPGAGLGRLAMEISCLGFICQGNEFSYYMMICSSFILNYTQVAGEWTIYPWIHSNCNSLSDYDQLRPVSFPDVHPPSSGITEGFSMCAGDFIEVYSDESQEASWDVVVTCFFLDTAHNVVEYIEIISKILRDGGVWINLGPLLYHFADAYGIDDDTSIELSLEDIKKVAFHYGFVLENEKTIETTYTGNPRAMMQTRYFAAFWTMKKIKA